jgi:excisionase family DNA binding protein
MIDNAIKKMEKEREEKEDFYNSHWQITISEAARITGISRQSFYRWINKGIIKTYSPSRNLIDLLELKETIKQQQKVEQNLFNKPIK